MFEFFLNYSPEAFARGQLVLAAPLPVWLLPVSFVVLGLLLAVYLLVRRPGPGLFRLSAIGCLQLAMLGLLLIILWQPALRIDQLRSGDNIIALLLDTSGSMNQGTEDGTRLEQAAALLRDSKAIATLQEDYEIRRFTFAEATTEVDTFEAVGTRGDGTNLGESILRVLRLSRTTPLGAVIVASDGSDNSGRLDREQITEIGRFGIPVHTIGIGRERIPDDLELEEIILPDRALPGTRLSASAVIRHDGKGMTRIKIYDGDRFLAAREVELPAGASVTNAMIDFRVPDKGHHDLSFTLEPLPGETNIGNNTRGQILKVAAEDYRILYIEGEPRWEYKFMRRAVAEDGSVALISLLRVSTNKFYRQGIADPSELEDGFPRDRRTLFGFDALIIGSIEAPVFTPEQQQLIHDFVSIRGGSLLMLAGPNGLGDGGWGNSLVSEVLPAQLQETGDGFRRERARVRLTAIGGNNPMLKLADEAGENLRLWNGLPEIADYQSIGRLRPAAVSLLNIRTGNQEQPLLVMQPYGRGRAYILATGGTWRWQMQLPVEDHRHETFWRQLMRGLVVNTPARFELSAQPGNDRITLQAQVFDENFAPAEDYEVSAIVTPETGEPLTVELRHVRDQPGVMSGEFIPDRSGLYNIEAISRRNDEPLDTARIALRHEAGRAENFSVRQDRTVLEGIAEATAGRYWTPDQVENLPDAIRHSGAGITEQQVRPLWNAPALFLLLIILKSLEWLLRRKWKTI